MSVGHFNYGDIVFAQMVEVLLREYTSGLHFE